MLFEVTHITRFSYSRPVFVEPLTIRLKPRSDLSQRLLAFQMRFDPAATGVSEASDVEGNAVLHAWFERLLDSLTLTTCFTSETLRPNPFDYTVLDPAALRLPMRYGAAERAALDRYLAGTADREVEAFAQATLRASGGDAQAFLLELAARICRSIEHRRREDGFPLPPAVTLAQGWGACRDLAALFMDACRSVGIASRFVSGYQGGDPGSEERQLHAWAEVYLSGAGWRGYDPSQGLAVADRHVAVASGPTARAAAATEGTLRGTGATSALTVEIDVRMSG